MASTRDRAGFRERISYFPHPGMFYHTTRLKPSFRVETCPRFAPRGFLKATGTLSHPGHPCPRRIQSREAPTRAALAPHSWCPERPTGRRVRLPGAHRPPGLGTFPALARSRDRCKAQGPQRTERSSARSGSTPEAPRHVTEGGSLGGRRDTTLRWSLHSSPFLNTAWSPMDKGQADRAG